MKSIVYGCLFSIGLILLAAKPQMAQAQAKSIKEIDWVSQTPAPHWIWDAKGSSDGQVIYLRKDLEIAGPIQSAKLYTTCDNRMQLWMNGKEVHTSNAWESPLLADVTKLVATGQNTIAVRAQNDGGVAAFVFKLVIDHGNKKKTTIISDETWSSSSKAPSAKWFTTNQAGDNWSGKLTKVNRFGAGPWGIPGKGGSRSGGAGVIAAEDIVLPEGFTAELVHEVDAAQHGSWVALSTMGDGRLIACDQAGKGAVLIEVKESNDGPSAMIEPIEVNYPGKKEKLSGAQGLLWAFDSLWFHKNGGNLYRVTDTDGDGKLDTASVVPSQTGGGEHGNHAVILTEDGQGIYMDGGNHAPLGPLTGSTVSNWQEDLLLPRMWDANGHARGRLAPGGWVTRLDPKTLEQELVCIGFRNQYDIALNSLGDLFTYDADMEWDMGSPWYRPTRICQVVSGGDYGWRSGTGKWPTYYEDSLPPVVEIGPGSPTGVASGTGAKFPSKYQSAIYALDWTFGTIYAIHMEPNGAGYRGNSEPFATGAPLPVTDAIVGQDGHFYFTIGGRGTKSALYRIRYTGNESTAPMPKPTLSEATLVARAQRKALEKFHGKEMSGAELTRAVSLALGSLGSEDRFLRAAARVALESQPTESWSTQVLQSDSAQIRITGAVALARVGEPELQSTVVESLNALDLSNLTRQQQLGWFRAQGLAMLRLGKPNSEQREIIIGKVHKLFPSTDGDINTESIRILVALKDTKVIEPATQLIAKRGEPSIPDWSELASRNSRYGGTVNALLNNHPPSLEIGYALMLRNLRSGWTLAQRRIYFEFLNAAAKGSGGSSFPGFLRNIRQEALGLCTDEHRAALQEITGENFDPVPNFEIQPIQGPGKKWTLDSARPHSNFKGASFEKGRSLYFAASCGKCHRFAGLGGNVGPDLTSIKNKFDVNYVIEHIIDPSKIISDQYQSSVVLTADGRSLTGLMSEADGKVVVYPADVNADPIYLAADDVEAVKPSPISQMPKGLIDGLNGEELRDLLAYLMSGGDPKDRRAYGR